MSVEPEFRAKGRVPNDEVAERLFQLGVLRYRPQVRTGTLDVMSEPSPRPGADRMADLLRRCGCTNVRVQSRIYWADVESPR